MLPLPCASIFPNDGVSGGKPRPRKSSAVRVTNAPLIINGKKKSVKLFESLKITDGQNHAGTFKLGESLQIGCADGWIQILQLQVEGKKRMQASDFIQGYNQAEITVK